MSVQGQNRTLSDPAIYVRYWGHSGHKLAKSGHRILMSASGVTKPYQTDWPKTERSLERFTPQFEDVKFK